MPAVSLKEQLGAVANVRDEAVLRTTLGAIVDAIQNIATKLDADSGVTATDFVSTTAAIVKD